MIDFSVNTSLNNAFSIDNEKVQTILSESLPLSEPSPLLPEGKFIYITVKLIKVLHILFIRIRSYLCKKKCYFVIITKFKYTRMPRTILTRYIQYTIIHINNI